MMIYLLTGAAITAWLAVLAFVFYSAVEKGSMANAFLLAGWLSISIAGVLWLIAEAEQRGPCLRYETGMQFNPATKTTMPYRFCAERGEWIEGSE